ncbi:MAG: SAM-dependent methyltransferase [Candidatus Nephrothrix sp. EaCA]|nr:MAG: SAM-dependent methyltransferase [Candidatus Nephrothrix sp. EaCA]
MAIYSTEIASQSIPSDNPIHQRLLYPYVQAAEMAKGSLLEVGCGEGRGVPCLMPRVSEYTAIDRNAEAIAGLQKQFPQGKYICDSFPPLRHFEAHSFDFAVSFQVIEHIKNDALFLSEISRVLKPGGLAMLTTPNRPMSLSRNPWHIREYAPEELAQKAQPYFSRLSMKGISGNQKVMAYYEQNKKSVEKIMKWDVLKLQYRLPGQLLRIPYEILNRMNRNKLKNTHSDLTLSINHTDFFLTENAEQGIDLFLIAQK